MIAGWNHGSAPRRPYALALSLVILACSAKDPPAAKASPEAAPEASVTPSPALGARPSAEVTAVDTPAIVDTPATVDTEAALAHQRAGRAHSKEGRWKAAIAEFERATASDPSDGRLLCELGWAHFRGDQSENAAASLSQGIALLEAHIGADKGLRKPLGACLYSLGRVVETRPGEDSRRAAAGHYRRSLELRPGNAVVERRLRALTEDPSEATVPAAKATTSIECDAGPGAVLDIAAWSEELRALRGSPERINPTLAKLGLSEIGDEPFIDYFSDDQTPREVHAEVHETALRLGERGEAVLLHVTVRDDDDGRAERVAVFLPRPSGALCLAGEVEHEQMMCQANCLGDDPPLKLSTIPLVAADVESLRIDTSTGACCGTDRGGVLTSSLYGVEGDALVRYLEITTMSAWYISPYPPVEETSATLEFTGDFPKSIQVRTQVSCTINCTDAELAALVKRIEAAPSDEASTTIMREIDDTCGPGAHTCEEKNSLERYVYSGGTYGSAPR